MDNARQWKMLTGVAAGGLVTAFIVAGCSGGSSGSLFSESTNGAGLSAVGVSTPSGTPTLTPKGTPLRTPGGTPSPTVKPTIKPTGGPTPLPTSLPNALFTTFSASGSLDAAGNFTEQAGRGVFSEFRLVRATQPTITPKPTTKPTPGATVTPGPTVTPEPGTFYLGTYTLSNGQKGNFYLVTRRDKTASGAGFPAVNLFGYNLYPVTNGLAAVSLHITGSTGSGTVKLTGFTGAVVATGTIKITSKQSFSEAANEVFDKLKIAP